MRPLASVAVGAVGVAVGVAAWTTYQNRTTPRVAYDVVGRAGGAEIRRYPRAVVAETVAPTERAAFGRLYRYISGENRSGEAVPMTAPVETGEPWRPGGEEVPVTAPVETDARRPAGGADAREVRMAFFLPASYDAEAAPEPTDSNVRLVDVPPQTLAVRRFTWRATDRRVGREVDRLFADVGARTDVTPASDPFLLRYDGPWTLPFLRRNEVAVEVETVG